MSPWNDRSTAYDISYMTAKDRYNVILFLEYFVIYILFTHWPLLNSSVYDL